MSSTEDPTEHLQRAEQLFKDGDVTAAFHAVKRVLNYPGMCSETAVFSRAMRIFAPIANQFAGKEHADAIFAAANDPDNADVLSQTGSQMNGAGIDGIKATVLARAHARATEAKILRFRSRLLWRKRANMRMHGVPWKKPLIWRRRISSVATSWR